MIEKKLTDRWNQIIPEYFTLKDDLAGITAALNQLDNSIKSAPRSQRATLKAIRYALQAKKQELEKEKGLVEITRWQNLMNSILSFIKRKGRERP